jgi:hypothetical protein
MLFPVTIFLSAFLLFQVQPMMGRFVLPWFGGGPAVWTTCMLFFQTALLAGYAYAHFLGSRGPTTRRAASWIHVALLAISVAALPIIPNAARWKPTTSENPSGQILLLLAATVGVPYFLLSATAPLLQRWFHNTRPEDSPWRLYALSNAGSLLALFSYQFLIEPWLRLKTQATMWSAGYVIFAALCAWVAWKFGGKTSGAEESSADADEATTETPQMLDIALWLGLSIVTSVLLLATTSQISQEVAVIPFLWIAPLAIYLLTFMLTFDSDRWYKRGVFAVLAGVLAPVTCAVVAAASGVPVFTQIAVDLGGLFAVCMVCHGELARSRPAAKYLTSFYLTIAAGGAIGGAFAALIAPRIFTELDEYPLALSAGCILGFASWMRGGALAQWTSRNFAVRVPLMALLVGGATSLYSVVAIGQPTQDARRNFYGILRVSERSDQNGTFRQLTHGVIQHGFEYLDAAKRKRPTSYYGSHSGVALAIDAVPKPRRVAVIGLGAGTIAAWGREGDTYRFYEINPAVEAIARQWFYYLKDSRASTEVVLGDARAQMERELAEGQSHDYNVIAVDAFSSDAIPIHLLTSECADLYRQRLAPGGILALHISNKSLDLEPVTRGIAQHLGWRARMVITLTDAETGENSSRWVLLTEKLETFQNSKIRDTILGWGAPGQQTITWTDDFASLWHILRSR